MPITTRTVTGKLYNPDNTPAAGRPIRFMLSGPAIDGATAIIILPLATDAVTGVDGTFSVDLWVTATGDRDTYYTVEVPQYSLRQFRLSAGGAIDLMDLAAPPLAPVISAIAPAYNYVEVFITAVDRAASYKIERKTGSGSFIEIATGVTSLPYFDYGRTGSTTYTYRAVATNYGGVDSAYSAEASATTPAEPAPTYLLLQIGNNLLLHTGDRLVRN